MTTPDVRLRSEPMYKFPFDNRQSPPTRGWDGRPNGIDRAAGKAREAEAMCFEPPKEWTPGDDADGENGLSVV
ncbi:MAG: hypothetical protein KDD69_10255 [Bdellovibrionales bacterium]|nr:hypothetical protein [Bdellovibrionales bacterium]